MTDTTTMTVAPVAGLSEGELIKTDRMGRMRFSREQRDRILDAFEASGLSGADFAKRHGVKYQTFATWMQKRRQEKQAGSGSGPAGGAPVWVAELAEVELTPEAGDCSGLPLTLKLPGGIEMTLSAASQAPVAAALLQALAR